MLFTRPVAWGVQNLPALLLPSGSHSSPLISTIFIRVGLPQLKSIGLSDCFMQGCVVGGSENVRFISIKTCLTVKRETSAQVCLLNAFQETIFTYGHLPPAAPQVFTTSNFTLCIVG